MEHRSRLGSLYFPTSSPPDWRQNEVWPLLNPEVPWRYNYMVGSYLRHPLLPSGLTLYSDLTVYVTV